MSEPTEESNIVKFEALKFPVIEYGVTEAEIAEVAERYKEPDASTDEGYERCKEGCKVLRAMRTAVETRRLDLKRPITEWVRVNVDVRGKELIRLIRVAEGPVREEKERADEIKQAEARREAEAEQQRVDAIRANIQKIIGTAAEQRPDDTAADYGQHITWLKELAINEEVFGELVDEANTARDAALFKLTQWHEQALQREADDIRRKEEQAKLDKEREELEAAQKKQRKAEAKLQKEKSEASARRTADERAERKKVRDQEAEREATEERRISDIKYVIETTRTLPKGSSSAALEGLITTHEANEPTEAFFAEFLPEARSVWLESIKTLRIMAKDEREAEAKRRRDEEARLPDKEKLVRWCDAIASIPEPEVLNDKAQKILRRYGTDLSKFVQRLQSDIGKL